VIPLDIIMPEMDGIVVCKKINLKNTLLILTALSDVESRVRGLNAREIMILQMGRVQMQ
jgi:DNA-binding response OmpR family regulator